MQPAVAAALTMLDAFLGECLIDRERESTARGALDGLRGMHVSAAEVRLALGAVIAPKLRGQFAGGLVETLRDDARWARLIDANDLDGFQTLALLLALAPEIDLRYQRVFAYLQDDITRRRPTVDFILTLCSSDRVERETRRCEFAPTGRLLARGLAELGVNPSCPASPLIAHFLMPDPLVVSFLVAGAAVDARLAHCAHFTAQEMQAAPDENLAPEWRAALAAVRSGVPAWLMGGRGLGEQACSKFIARMLGRALVTLDAERIAGDQLAQCLRLALRMASLNNACLLVLNADGVCAEGMDVSVCFATDVPLLFSSRRLPAPPLCEFARVFELLLPDTRRRREEWSRALATQGHKADAIATQQLASRFRFTTVQIRAAAASARGGGATELFAAARAQCNSGLDEVAQKIEPRARWDDLILPEDSLRQISELCERVDARERVFEEWGFGARQARGRGVSALFSGPSGTGKTMAAEVLANELGLNLYRVDLARVVSKYIGETEKNLERVFGAATDANAIVLFDEADALFGKRSEVKDAHDRHANIEVAYLLQRMEDHDGVTILATNLADNIDRAFTRRLSFFVQFPFPDVADRLRLWRRAWPDRAPTAQIDHDALARQFRITGGSIRNVALAASFLAAKEDGAVRMSHVMHALRREHQKLGTTVTGERQLGLAEVVHGRI
ncbi:MAG: ATP-binding protein [Pseudomonadota bacterium]